MARREPMNAAADQVMDLIFGRWRSQILSAGTELAVFDRLDKRTAKRWRLTTSGVGEAPPASRVRMYWA